LAQLGSDPVDFVRRAWRHCGNRDAVTCASLADLVTYLPCALMTKVDIASMAHGLETRAPILDYRVVEFAASLPLALKYRWGRGKLLLREAFGHLLPSEVFTRKKMGFGVPLDSWFREDLKGLAEDLLLSDNARCHAFLRPEAIRSLWDTHQARRYDYSGRLWALVMLESWLRRWDVEPPASQGAALQLAAAQN
jgi:asparagine synthase (glutamine-hydrolysing)